MNITNRTNFYDFVTKEYIYLILDNDIESKLNILIDENLLDIFLWKFIDIYRNSIRLDCDKNGSIDFLRILRNIKKLPENYYRLYRKIIKIHHFYFFWRFQSDRILILNMTKEIIRIFENTNLKHRIHNLNIFTYEPELRLKLFPIDSNSKLKQLSYDDPRIPSLLEKDIGRRPLNSILNKALKFNRELFNKYVNILIKKGYIMNLDSVIKSDHYIDVIENVINITGPDNKYFSASIYATIIKNGIKLKMRRCTEIQGKSELESLQSNIGINSTVLDLVGGVVEYVIDHITVHSIRFGLTNEIIYLYHDNEWSDIKITSEVGEDGFVKRKIAHNNTSFDNAFILSCIPRYLNIIR